MHKAPSTAARTGRFASAANGCAVRARVAFDVIGLERSPLAGQRGATETALDCEVPADMPALPSGTVTFLFSDIEGSTHLAERLGDGWRALLEQHREIVRSAIAGGEGVEVGTEGDSFFAAFPTAGGALSAAVEAQRLLAAHEWPEGSPIRVRIGLHTGEA